MITSLKTVIFTLEWVIKDLVECLFIACSRRSDSGAGTVNIESREKTRSDSGETAKELASLPNLFLFSLLSISFLFLRNYLNAWRQLVCLLYVIINCR